MGSSIYCSLCKMYSNDFIQELSKTLYDRALVYLNIDIAVAGHDHIRVAATPLLYNALYTATKMVYICIVCYTVMYEISCIIGHDNYVTS